MSLSKSLLTTVAIFTLVWTAILLNTSQYSVPVKTFNTPDTLQQDLTNIQLVGISSEVHLGESMDDVNALWQQFYDLTDLHLAVDPQMAKRAYGLYRFRDSDTDKVDLFIGYNTGGRSLKAYSTIASLSLDDYQKISENLESWDTSAAWNAIDHDKAVHSVLEEYEMDDGGEVIATRVYVYYQ